MAPKRPALIAALMLTGHGKLAWASRNLDTSEGALLTSRLCRASRTANSPSVSPGRQRVKEGVAHLVVGYARALRRVKGMIRCGDILARRQRTEAISHRVELCCFGQRVALAVNEQHRHVDRR